MWGNEEQGRGPGRELDVYRAMGYGHATLSRWGDTLLARLRSQSGQGTVEYIGLVLLMVAIMGVVVSKSNAGQKIGNAVIKQISDAVSTVGGK